MSSGRFPAPMPAGIKACILGATRCSMKCLSVSLGIHYCVCRGLLHAVAVLGDQGAQLILGSFPALMPACLQQLVYASRSHICACLSDTLQCLLCVWLQLLPAVAELGVERLLLPLRSLIPSPHVCKFEPRYAVFRSWCRLCPFFVVRNRLMHLVMLIRYTTLCLLWAWLQLLHAVAVLSESRDTAPALTEPPCPDVCTKVCSLSPLAQPVPCPFLYCLTGSPLRLSAGR